MFHCGETEADNLYMTCMTGLHQILLVFIIILLETLISPTF